MKKDYRIRKNEEFSKIIAQKHSFSNPCFIIYSSNKVLEHSRVGISVSKRLGDAVHRNKIKRQLREMIHHVYDFENSPKDLIVIVKNKFLENDFKTNETYLEKLIKKAII